MQAQSVEDGYDGFDLPEDDDYYDSAREDGNREDFTIPPQEKLEERFTRGAEERALLRRLQEIRHLEEVPQRPSAPYYRPIVTIPDPQGLTDPYSQPPYYYP